MFSKMLGKDKTGACQTIFGMMVQASEGVIRGYQSDLWHDAMFLNNRNKEKNFVDRQVKDEESIFWSVGDCGSHIAILSDAGERAWMKIDSYAKYAHYRVWFSIAESGMITVQLIPVPNTEPKQLTSE